MGDSVPVKRLVNSSAVSMIAITAIPFRFRFIFIKRFVSSRMVSRLSTFTMRSPPALRYCCPPDSSFGSRSNFCSSPSASTISSKYLFSGVLPSNFTGSTMFSQTVSIGTRLYCWNTNPIFLRRKIVSSSALISLICCPSTVTVPDVGVSNPPIMCKSVDLPLPEVPTMERNSPFCTERFTLFKATTSVSPFPYIFVRSCVSKIVILSFPFPDFIPFSCEHPIVMNEKRVCIFYNTNPTTQISPTSL